MRKYIMLTSLVAILSLSCKNIETNNDQNTNKVPSDTTADQKNSTVEIREKLDGIQYKMMKGKTWLKANEKNEAALQIVMDANRTDKLNLAKMDSIIVPNKLDGKREDYLPFPLQVQALKNVDKIIFFSYPTQTFAAYKNGKLAYTGPTNMGREKDPTPTGLFFTNWKAEKTNSTFNDEWELKWNFNIENKLGVGFHEYQLPGYPASHSCLRLQENDAKYLYEWANQWVLADKENVKAKGTPVIVFGEYPFKGKKPWLQLLTTPKSFEISEDEITQLVAPKMEMILKEQNNSKLVAQNKE
ncbi:L,D-transpeptidase [Flavobacterium sp. 7A]|uniref:L,D-transpeptidase n=1 Tax=Flavobacterium sp. 7A TaxID=2940571 RepID=UPI002227E9CF|nr:L,D-transpeptidase [Flavobacterium sp. 7A]MCW2119213.1 lipoprotein-anchoring transpeptidase ErfK/SrfK [Flavobacterium sp. 7A]